MNIALISPNNNAYSESFIQAHKKLIAGTVFYYFNGELPTQLEGGLIINSRKTRIVDILRGHYNLNKYSLAEKALLSSFKKNKIDLVFAEYGTSGEKILPICRELKLPLIVHFHGFEAAVKSVIESHDNYKEIFNYASTIVVVSKKMKEDLLRLGCPENKLYYNVYGPRDEFLDVKPRFVKPQFIAIGRFVNKKAPYYLILAFLKVINEYPQAKLIMAGEGELLNTCKNLVKFYRLEGNIKFVGIISSEEYRAYLEESLAFVQHSITAEDGDSEGTPVAILEASAAGLPVISTKHAGIPDVIVHEKTGLLVEEHDVDGMAENMIRLLRDIKMAKEMGREGKLNIKENFNMDKHIETLNTVIKNSIMSH